MREACVTRTRVHLEGALEVKGSNVEDPLDGDVGARAPLDGRVGVHRLEARLDADKVRLLHEIRLVEQDCAKKERGESGGQYVRCHERKPSGR